MKTSLTISASQADVLRELMLYRLFPIGDRRLRQARLEGTSHEQIAEEFAEDLRLMQDLDWGASERKAVRDQIAGLKDFPGLEGALTMGPKGDMMKGVYVIEARGGAWKLYDIVR